MRFRRMFAVTATCLVAGLVPVVAWAGPSDPPSAGLLSEVDAVREARASGLPVVASALTDERTLVTADPVSGELTAVVSAGVARVRDGSGGWRAPSARLVAGADGLLRPEAAVAQIAVSPGGSGRLLSVGDGAAEAAVSWAGALPTPVVDGATATYPEVFPGVDLVVRADVESAETFLVVKTAAAGRDPRVRSFSFGLSLAGLTVRDTAGGARSLVDAAGVERLVVPQARMWDSAGKEQGLDRAAEVVEEGLQSRSAAVGLSVAAGRLSLSPSATMLDDPATVFPVVIDPQVSLTRSYVVRVTEEFNTINDMSVDGKIGYNGWTSPYYKSRMFYQFRWPKGANDQQLVLGGSQITAAEFRYVQKHSPQHSCGGSFGPGIKVKLYNTISSSTTWPGPGAHVHSPVTTSLAVGHEDYGCAPKTQIWNITSMMKAERDNSSYNTRTTATIGVYSADESDRDGWRHYSNSPGPELRLTFLPATEDATLSIPGSDPGTVWVHPSSTAVLNAGVALRAGITCKSGVSCLKGRITSVQGPGGAVAGFPTAWSSTSGTSLPLPTATLTGLVDSQAYTVTVEAQETATETITPKSFTFWSDQFPGTAPAGVAFAQAAGGAWLTSGLVDNGTPQLHATASLPSGATCLVVTACLQVTFAVVDTATSATVWQSTLASAAPGSTVQTQVPTTAALLDNHQYRLDVWSEKTTNHMVSPVNSITFGVAIRPGTTTVTAPGAGSLPVTVSFTNASTVAKYVWSATCANGPQATGETTTSSATIAVPGCTDRVLVKAKAVSPSGLDGPWSDESTIILF